MQTVQRDEGLYTVDKELTAQRATGVVGVKSEIMKKPTSRNKDHTIEHWGTPGLNGWCPAGF